MNNTHRHAIIETERQGNAKNFLEISIKEFRNTGANEETQRKKSTLFLM